MWLALMVVGGVLLSIGMTVGIVLLAKKLISTAYSAMYDEYTRHF